MTHITEILKDDFYLVYNGKGISHIQIGDKETGYFQDFYNQGKRVEVNDKETLLIIRQLPFWNYRIVSEEMPVFYKYEGGDL